MPLFPAPPISNPPRPFFKRQQPMLFLIGGSEVLTAGVERFLRSDVTGILRGWTLSCEPEGSLVLDVVKGAGPTPPSVSIVGATAPTLVAARFSSSDDLTGWDIEVEAGNLIGIEIVSVALITQFTLQLQIY